MDGAFSLCSGASLSFGARVELLLHAGNGVLGVIDQNHLYSFIDEQKVPI